MRFVAGGWEEQLCSGKGESRNPSEGTERGFLPHFSSRKGAFNMQPTAYFGELGSVLHMFPSRWGLQDVNSFGYVIFKLLPNRSLLLLPNGCC